MHLLWNTALSNLPIRGVAECKSFTRCTGMCKSCGGNSDAQEAPLPRPHPQELPLPGSVCASQGSATTDHRQPQKNVCLLGKGFPSVGEGTGDQGPWLGADEPRVPPAPSTDMQVLIKERQRGDRGCVGQLSSDSIFPKDK